MAQVIKCCCAAGWRSNFYSGRLFTLPALLYFPQDAQIGRLYTNPPNHVGTPNLGVLYQSTNPLFPSFPSQSERKIRKTSKLSVSTLLYFPQDAQIGRLYTNPPNHVGTPNLGVLYQSTNPLFPSFPSQSEGKIRKTPKLSVSTLLYFPLHCHSRSPLLTACRGSPLLTACRGRLLSGNPAR